MKPKQNVIILQSCNFLSSTISGWKLTHPSGQAHRLRHGPRASGVRDPGQEVELRHRSIRPDLPGHREGERSGRALQGKGWSRGRRQD